MESRHLSSGPGNTVLVVNEDPKAFALIARELRRRGLDVAIATSSAEAFTSACQTHPSAMVVELSEPGGALPLLRTLAGDIRTQDIPVIVAQCEDESSRAQAQRIGNVVVLMGDCSPETVAAEVDRVLLESAGTSTPQVRPAFPITCPKCGQKAGVPRSVSTAGNGGTYISVFCEQCSQQWCVFRQSDAPGFVKL